MTKVMPAEVTLGDEFMYEITPQAMVCVADVVITDIVPEGATYVRSDPAAEVDGRRLIWRFPEMEAGETRPIKVWIRADREGTLASCATVHALPRVCAQTIVGRALIAIQKTGPETAILGSDISYNIMVSNSGTAIARNVVVVDELPDGLVGAGGQSRMTFNLGDLPPGQSKTITVPAKAAKRGKFCNGAAVATANAGEAKAEACTTILQPGLKIVKTGTKEQFLNRLAKYNIVISNTGDTVLTGVVVTDTAPAATAIVEASGASVSGNTATWNVGNLDPGAEKSFAINLTSQQAGNHCNMATVTSGQGLRESSEACTVWRGLGGMLLEMVDDPDPIKVDDETLYNIRVTNQGTADLHNIKTSAAFDDEVTPISTSSGNIAGQQVTFPVVPTLGPKQSFSLSVKVRGVKIGDARNRVSVTSDEIPRPVVEEESTQVY